MQPIARYSCERSLIAKIAQQPRQIISALALIGIVSVGASLTFVDAAAAAPQRLSQRLPESIRPVRLPPAIANAVRQDLSRQQGIPINKLRIVKAERKTWPDPCLGIPRPDELCAQVATEGWQVVVTDGSKEWTYRTDSTGRTLRAFNSPNTPNQGANLPQSVAIAVKRDLSKQSGLPIDALRIVKAERRQWPNGCLGLPNPAALCTQAIVPGWEVTVMKRQGSRAGQQRWIYRTNENGSVVALDKSASNTGDTATIQPTKIPKSELPSRLPRNAVFRAISSGGFAGRSYETTLMKNGRVIQTEVGSDERNSQPTEIRKLSEKQVREFQQLLERQNFDRYNGLDYPPASGSADYVSVTLSGSDGTTRYADSIQSQLPRELQEVIDAWTRIATRR